MRFYARVFRPNWARYRPQLSRPLSNSGTDYCPLGRSSLYPERRVVFVWIPTPRDGQLGCCLLQDQPDGKPLPVGFWSRTLNSAEQNYSRTEKECLGIVWAVTHLRPYLEGTKFTVRTNHHAIIWVMNGHDVQVRLALRRLRLAEFTLKVEYHPGVAHHAADAMSRLPHQAVPSDPIEEEIPICAVAHEESQEPDFPTALEEVTSDPITEISILSLEDLFESQCLDPTTRRNGAACVHDPTWYYDRHGIMARRAPSGDTEVYIPHTLRRHGPHAIVITVAADGPDLRRGDTGNSIANSPDYRSDPKCDPPKFRLLTRGPRPTRERDTYVGLASLLEPNSDDRIPTGTEVEVATISTEELRREQAVDPICKKLLLSTDKSLCMT
jgi:RNase H-like domain found in reverse transcriptase